MAQTFQMSADSPREPGFGPRQPTPDARAFPGQQANPHDQEQHPLENRQEEANYAKHDQGTSGSNTGCAQ
jgi:hypothetical protein